MTDNTDRPELAELRKMLHMAPFHRWLGLDVIDLTERELILEMPWREEIISNPMAAQCARPPTFTSIFTALQPPVHCARLAEWSNWANS